MLTIVSVSVQVLYNTIGPRVTAEMVDVKENSQYGLIEGNTFDGSGESPLLCLLSQPEEMAKDESIMHFCDASTVFTTPHYYQGTQMLSTVL